MRQLEVWKLLVERGKILDEVREKKADVLGLSALLTTTMPFMSRIIKTLDEVGLRSSVKVIVGGAPVTQDYANYIGADAYAYDGGKAVTVRKQLVGK
jgi:5-methyltetrahydrofolate--homocysteine methyltransferase